MYNGTVEKPFPWLFAKTINISIAPGLISSNHMYNQRCARMHRNNQRRVNTRTTYECDEYDRIILRFSQVLRNYIKRNKEPSETTKE